MQHLLHNTPTQIQGFSESYNFKKIRLGTDAMCGILLNDQVVCMGSNYYRKVSDVAQDNITPSLATKVIDPITLQPMVVKDVGLPQNNTIIFVKE